MISFPLSLTLIPYTLVMSFAVIIALFTVYHLVRYGATTKVSFVMTFIFFAGSVYLFFFTWSALKDTDWNRPVVIHTAFSSDGDIDEFGL